MREPVEATNGVTRGNIMPFTDKQIAALKPKAGRYEKPEPGRTGLRIRVSPKGEKRWTFTYRFAGEQKRMLLGHYPRTGVASAHKALGDAREKLKQGIDPGAIVAEERRAEREAETIADLVNEYLERHARKNMKPNTAASDEWMLNREIVSEWGTRKAKDITRRDIIKLLDGIEDRPAPVLRNRVASVLSRLFRFALDRGVVDASPAVGVRRLEERSRDRFLTVTEIRAFWNGLDEADMTPAVRTALRFLLVTGQRRAEVAGATAAEVDRKESLWRVPSERTKNGRENLVPLPRLALRLLADADALRVRPKPIRANRKGRPAYDETPSQWQFPSWRLGRPLEPAALTRALNRNRAKLGIGDATVHDIRRTFATWHGELGTAPEILSALLNHAPVTITGRVYDRASHLEPRRKAMSVWCDWLERVVAGAKIAENVVQLKRSVPIQ
jgi:integrase